MCAQNNVIKHDFTLVNNYNLNGRIKPYWVKTM